MKAARPKWRTVPLALMKRDDPMAAAARRRQPPYPHPPPHAPPPPCPRCRNHADARGAYAHTCTRSQARGVCGDGGYRRTTTAAAAVPRGHACRPSLPQRPRRLPAAAVTGCRSWQSARVAAAPDAASHAAAVALRPVAATAAAATPGQGARGALAANHSVGKRGRVRVASKKTMTRGRTHATNPPPPKKGSGDAPLPTAPRPRVSAVCRRFGACSSNSVDRKSPPPRLPPDALMASKSRSPTVWRDG